MKVAFGESFFSYYYKKTAMYKIIHPKETFLLAHFVDFKKYILEKHQSTIAFHLYVKSKFWGFWEYHSYGIGWKKAKDQECLMLG